MSRVYALFLVLWLCVSCGRYARLRRSEDWEEKYSGAVVYYKAGSYAKSSVLFEDVLHLMKGTEEGEDGLFYYADALYEQKQYVLSAYHFNEFYATYTKSPRAYDALHKQMKTLYFSSYDYNLSPTSTHSAIATAQEFLDTYPNAPNKQEAEDILDELQKKLSTKAFEQAKLYYLMHRFKAAIVTFENFKKDFPSSALVEKSHYFSVLSQYRLAERSVVEKKAERYRRVLDMYENFADKYSGSEDLLALSAVYTKSLQALEAIAEDGSQKKARK